MFHSNPLSPKYSTAPHISQVFMRKGLGRQGRGQFQGVRRRTRQTLFPSVCVCACVCHFCTRMAGWVGLVHSSDVILPGFGFVPTLAQPTGSFAAVSQLLSRSLSPPLSVCVFVCVLHRVASYLLHTRSSPGRLCSLLIWTLEAMSCRLCPCQRILQWLFFASEGGQPSSSALFSVQDNLNVFLKACGKLGLKEAQLFHPGDLQDLSTRVTVK